MPKGIGYMPDDGPFSRAQWGLLKRKAMTSRVKSGRFANGHIGRSLIRRIKLFNPNHQGGGIVPGPPVGNARYWKD
jgi:hypothetical protein